MQKVLFWAGVVGGIAAGVVAIIGAIVTKHIAYAAWGVTAIALLFVASVVVTFIFPPFK